MQQNQTPQKVPLSSLLDKYDNFFFDCDGVLYNGVHYLEKTFDALNKLKQANKNVFFVTNMSRASRTDAFEKISAGGFTPDIDKVFTSSYLAARYLKLNHPEIKKVYIIGMEGVREELEQQGLTVLGGESDDEKKMNGAVFEQMKVDEDIKAVVAALDYDINFYKLCYASVLIQKGALFIATNPDSNVKLNQHKMPGGGCVVKFLEFSVGKEAYIVGKPNPVAIEIATKTFGLDKSRSLMIGDRLDTDIMVGKNAGIDTFAVLTGVTSEEELLREYKKENGTKPTYYWDRVEI